MRLVSAWLLGFALMTGGARADITIAAAGPVTGQLAGLGEQMDGTGRVRLELAAQLGHVDAQVVGLLVVARPPHLVEQLALGHEPSDIACQ